LPPHYVEAPAHLGRDAEVGAPSSGTPPTSPTKGMSSSEPTSSSGETGRHVCWQQPIVLSESTPFCFQLVKDELFFSAEELAQSRRQARAEGIRFRTIPCTPPKPRNSPQQPMQHHKQQHGHGRHQPPSHRHRQQQDSLRRMGCELALAHGTTSMPAPDTVDLARPQADEHAQRMQRFQDSMSTARTAKSTAVLQQQSEQLLQNRASALLWRLPS